MQIQLNGHAQALSDRPTITELLERNGYAGRRVAVEVNCAIVPRSEHGTRLVAEGDVVEIVSAIGGG